MEEKLKETEDAGGEQGAGMGDRLEGDGGIRPGLNVDIRRTDGRVHAATVTAVDLRTGLVTVEWFEGGETKGKQLERAALLRLNPALCSPPVSCHALLTPDKQQDREAPRSPSPVNAGRRTRQADVGVEVLDDLDDRTRQRTKETHRERHETADLDVRKSSDDIFEHRVEPLAPRGRKTNRHNPDEEEALRELVRKYRALIDVSELWMTADVRMLTRVASGRAAEEAWVRELEELLHEKLDLLAGLKDAVVRYRKIREAT